MDLPRIDIALTFNDNYWAPAYATIRSVCLASRRPADLVFHLVHIGISPEHAAVLDDIAREFPARIDHIDLAAHPAYQSFVGDLPMAAPFNPVIYARLLLDAVMPPDVERVVYLDCDLLVRGPLEEIAIVDLQGKALAAVLEVHRHHPMLGRDFRENADLFTFHQPYFNAGMLVIDRRAYGRADVPGRTIALNEAGTLKRLQYDQGALNVIFGNDWLPLDFRWNLINPLPAHENLEPHILHYTGYRKPWNLVSPVAFARAYRHTMTNAIFYRYWRERQLRRLRRPFRRLSSKA